MKSYKAGRYIDADQEFRAALEAKANASPKEDEKTAIMLNNLGATCEKLHQPREADKLYRRAIAICEVTLPTGHARTEHIRSKLKALQGSLFAFPGLPGSGTRVEAMGRDFVSE